MHPFDAYYSTSYSWGIWWLPSPEVCRMLVMMWYMWPITLKTSKKDRKAITELFDPGQPGTDYRQQFNNLSWPYCQKEHPYHKLIYTVQCNICKDTAWLAAIQMNAILNYDTINYTSTLLHWYQQVVSFHHGGKEIVTWHAWGGPGFWFTKKRPCGVNSAHQALKVLYHTISPSLEIQCLLLLGSFRNVPIDSVCCQHPWKHSNCSIA